MWIRPPMLWNIPSFTKEISSSQINKKIKFVKFIDHFRRKKTSSIWNQTFLFYNNIPFSCVYGWWWSYVHSNEDFFIWAWQGVLSCTFVYVLRVLILNYYYLKDIVLVPFPSSIFKVYIKLIFFTNKMYEWYHNIS